MRRPRALPVTGGRGLTHAVRPTSAGGAGPGPSSALRPSRLGLAIGANIGWFYYHSHTVGHALVNQEERAIRSASSGPAPTPEHCPAFDGSSSAPQGLLEAPAIALQAPVLAGVDDNELNVAVGHVPASAWPGQPGTTILAAHDVTYFSAIDHLAIGQRVAFATPCRTYVFVVTGHQIVTSGSPVYSSPSQSLLVLETCYPLNALYITSQRYLVTAQFQGTEQRGKPVGAVANLAESQRCRPRPSSTAGPDPRHQQRPARDARASGLHCRPGNRAPAP